MRFTMLVFGVPLVVSMLTYRNPELRSITLLFGMWLLASIPVVGIYWLTRLVRFAWRGTPARAID